MKEDSPRRGKPPFRTPRSSQPTRKLTLASRVRDRFHEWLDRVLAADAAWSAAFVVVVVVMLGSQRCGGGLEHLVVGEPAPFDISASYDVDVVDEELTEERRRQARGKIHQFYTHDSESRIRLATQMAGVFDEGRRALEEASLQGNEDPQATVAELFRDRVDPGALQAFLEQHFNVAVERELVSAFTEVMSQLVVANKALLERESAVLLLHLPGRLVERLDTYDDIVSLETARASLAHKLESRLTLAEERKLALAAFAVSYLDANIHLDAAETAKRRERAAAAVPPILVRVARGELLIKRGEIVSEQQLEQLEAAHEEAGAALGLRELVAMLLVASMLAFFLHRYSSYHQRHFRKLKHLHALLVFMLISMMLLTRAMMWLAGELVDSLAVPFDQLASYTYLVPIGAGAILVALLTNGRVASVYAGFAALLFAAVNGEDFSLLLWATVVQFTGIYAIATYRERAALLRAGAVVGVAGAVTVLALETLNGDLDPLARTLYGAGLALVGGAVGTGLLVSFLLPILEGLFRVLTDIRLLELSNVNNPLLSQLALKAPGSYNHSLVVATLADEGAKSIGANSLFCRVAAFYHDIGKINHPEYFVENQRGVNPHDRLAPSMSALIIASHVKDGIKLAREAGLPQQIIDIIPQHHGTRLMSYFYEKAKNSVDPSLGPVKEEDFRYPGPKPQTKEAAIFMLADGVEAAARTVDEPTPNRLKEVIRKVTNAIVLDRQLDSCDLTFADLERIQEAFHRLLVGMYHHRVDYPGFEFGRSRTDSKTSGVFSERKVART